jgi:outer membrane protein OmpA-like peptidoglycan-associated protein
MKKLNLLFLFFALFTAHVSQAQNQYYPWAVGFSYAGVDYAGSNGDKALKLGNFNSSAQISAARHLFKGLSAFGTAHLGTLRKPEQNWRSSTQFWNVALGGQYSFANGYILPEDFVVEPYVFLGAGVHNEGKNFTVPMGVTGLGLNVWLNDAAAINIQTSFNKLFSKGTFQPSYDIYSAGVRFRLGTGKDTDGDGIIDKEDACPDKAGVPAFKGCPDTDGDGLEDSKDDCPTQAGTLTFNGCPDSDGDGIKDADDACPSEAGSKDMRGCPDKDGDGLSDKEDSCPTMAGTKSLNGCPDSDGDGIADKDDACPMQKGSSQFKGCPDSDGDGIADKDDNCPNEKGVASRQGCPEPVITKEKEKEVEKQLEMDAKMIQFETGSAVIKTESYDDLDKIVALMKQYPSAKFAIEGHTDNVGDAKANKTLSQNRADAVKKYITDKSVDSSRISAVGYGIEKPIANNATPAGRQQNRRVEIHLAK